MATVLIVRSGQSEAGAQPTGQRLLRAGEFQVDDVVRITLARRDEPVRVYELNDAGGTGGWRQVSPIVHAVEAYSIRQLAIQAAALDVIHVFDAGDLERDGFSAASLGLDPPEATMTFELEPENSSGEGALEDVTLELGRRGLGGRAYIRRPGDDRIYVVSSRGSGGGGESLHERAISMDPREWRDRRLFPGLTVEADRIAVENVGLSFELARERRQWRMVSPVNSRTDETAFEQYLEALIRSASSGYIVDQPDRLEQFGLADPAATLTVNWSELVAAPSTEAGEPPVPQRIDHGRQLLVGNRISMTGEDRFSTIARANGETGPVFRLAEPVLAVMFRDPRELVAMTGCGVRPPDVKSIRIVALDHDIVLERQLESWIAPDLDNAPVNQDAVGRLLAALTDARATALEFADFPHDASIGHVTFYGFDGRPVDTVRLARDPASGRWIFDNGETVQRYFPGSLDLPLTPDEFGLRSQ